MVKYITAYIRDHYDFVRLKRDVAERLREFARSRGMTISDAVSYLLSNSHLLTNTNLLTNITDEVAGEVAEYVKVKYSSTRAKLIQYPGGDYFVFDDLIKVIIAAPSVKTFVELFGGSCWMSLNVPRSKFRVVVCNDIDRDLITLYRIVREKPDEITKYLSLLPFSRELHEIAFTIVNDKSADPLIKSVMLFYLSRTSFNGFLNSRTGFAVSKKTNEARKYSSAVAAIAEYAKRFRDVVLESKDYREIIKMYDHEQTLFYLDPPYVGKDRDYYRFGFTVNDLRTLARVLGSVRGKWVLKIAKDNYEIISNILPSHRKREIERTLAMKKVVDESRPLWKFVIAYNY